MKPFKWYVYQLSCPETGQIFYIGKGSGNRIDRHEKEALNGVCSKKCNKIRSIINKYGNISKNKIAYFKDEQDAYDFETEKIAEIGLINLTNIMPGGQKAFTRRLNSYKERKRIGPTPYETIINSEHIIRYWANLTDCGRYKVIAEKEAGYMQNFKNAIGRATEFMFNGGTVEKVLKICAKDEKARPEIERILGNRFDEVINASA